MLMEEEFENGMWFCIISGCPGHRIEEGPPGFGNFGCPEYMENIWRKIKVQTR